MAHMALDAATSAAVATAAGKTAFSYNRANYMFDQGLRFGRYTSAYSFSMTQAAQYREDIRDMAGFTTAKQDTYHVVGIIFFVLAFQLIMAGRLGVHGPSPPGWLLGLYWTNICTAILFLVTFTWLSLHASARATSGMAHMLTRNVRLPIPSPKQLDKARKTGNSFEKQRMTDVFRIPFVAPANRDTLEEDADDIDLEKAGRKMPRWYLQDEKSELMAGQGGAPPTPNSIPDHFELYRGLAQEWHLHDTYARVGMLFFISHWLSAANLFQMCHCFTELRAMWPAWSCCAVFSAAHYCILKVDINPKPGSDVSFSLPMERIVPFTPWLCVLGMSIDYSVLDPAIGWQAFIFFLSWICYIVHFLFEVRLFVLATPQQEKEDKSTPARGAGMTPAAFQDAVLIVQPPTHLEPGQSCLQQEMRAGRNRGSELTLKKARTTEQSMFAWRIFRGACTTAICMWIFIMVGRIFEHLNGERALLKQEGRVMRWPSHMQPWMPPWTRSGDWETKQAWCHAGGCDRRLAEEHREMQTVAQRLASALGHVAETLEKNGQPAPRAAPAAHFAKVSSATQPAWPSKVQPTLLAFGRHGSVAALGHGHQGALVRMASGAAAPELPTPFSLRGFEDVGAPLGAAWGESGLMVAHNSGHLVECAGLPGAGGEWQCKRLGAPLPLGGASLSAAVATRVGKIFRAAVTFAGEQGVVLLEREDAPGAEWVPSGEVQVPLPAGQVLHLSLSHVGDELLISTGDGGVLKWPMGAAAPVKVAALDHTAIGAPAMPNQVAWHGLCSVGGGRVAHLASMPGAAPKLLISSSE